MDVVIAAARQGSATGESVAIRADQKSYNYSQLISSARKISSLLCNGDIKPGPSDVIGSGHLGGARIGIVAKPSAEFVAGVLGTWLSGGVAVPLALSYPEAELLHVMSDSDVAMVLSTEDHSESLENIAAKSDAQFSLIPTVPSNFSHTDINDSLPDEADSVKSLAGNFQTLSRVEGDDPALIVYTSGTTGKPKGIVHTHKSINAQVKILAEAWEYTSSDQFLHSLPLHHVHGLFNALFAPLYAGSTVEFIPKFSVRGIWQRFRESYPTDGTKADDAITVFTGVPTMYTRLIQGYDAMDPDLQRTSASAAANLRLMMCGSSAMPYPVMKRWDTITGHRLLERYGMTEFVMAIANPLRGERKPGTVGKPFPGVEVKILADEESGDDATGVGELCVRSPSLFKEYWKLPEVTKDSFIDGGFFKTGDTVRVDEDGYYIILGRTSADIMKVGGYKLSALDIESVLLEHPIIAECSVFGLPDKDYGEAVCVVVVPEADAKRKQEAEQKPAITLEELCAWAKDRLAPYKLPSKLFLWDSVPRNAMGKRKQGKAMGEKGEAEAVQRSVRLLEDMSKGVGSHEIKTIALQGLQILQARRGFVSCNFIVSPLVSDKDGNWHVGAMTTLIDDVGAAAICSAAGHVKASLDFTISYFSTAKIHEEVVIEAKVKGDKGKLTSVVVEVRRKQNGELIALAKQWMASNNNAVPSTSATNPPTKL